MIVHASLLAIAWIETRPWPPSPASGGWLMGDMRQVPGMEVREPGAKGGPRQRRRQRWRQRGGGDGGGTVPRIPRRPRLLLVRLPPLAAYLRCTYLLACLVPRETEGPPPSPGTSSQHGAANASRQTLLPLPLPRPPQARTKQAHRFTILGWLSDWVLL